MSIELPDPGTVKGFADLENAARPQLPWILEQLDTARRLDEGIIQPSYRLSPELSGVAGRLACFLYAGEAEPVRAEGTEICQQSLKLGLLLANYILPSPEQGISMHGFDTELAEAQQYIHSAPSRFLEPRPSLNLLVRRYAPASANTPQHCYAAEQMIGLTLLQIDRYNYDIFIHDQIASMDDELAGILGG